MSANISRFLSTIGKRGVARNNRFLCLIPPIRGIKMFSNPLMNAVITQVAGKLPGNSALGVALICTKAEIPTRTFMTADKREYPKPIEQIPYAEAPSTTTMSFIVGRDMFEYYFFENWTNDIINRETNLLNYYDEYTTSIIVSQLDETDTVISSVEYEGCYPVSVSKISMDMSATNQYVTLDVEMRYKKYRPILTPFSLAETALSLVNKAAGVVAGSLKALNPLSKISLPF